MTDLRTTADLEKRALEQLQEAAADGRVYPDVIALVDQVIREAHQRGYQRAAVEIADAYSLYLVEDDDLDLFRDALTERLPADWKPPKRRKQPAALRIPGTTDERVIRGEAGS